MTTFTDNTGAEWKLRLTVGSLAELRAAGLDLSKALRTAEGLAEVLFADPEGLVKALWVLCDSQAKDAGVSPEAFAHRFDGPVLEAATEALLGTVADFFPRSAVARAMRANQSKLLARMDDLIVREMERRTAAALNGTAGSSPGTPASTPAPSPSAS